MLNKIAAVVVTVDAPQFTESNLFIGLIGLNFILQFSLQLMQTYYIYSIVFVNSLFNSIQSHFYKATHSDLSLLCNVVLNLINVVFIAIAFACVKFQERGIIANSALESSPKTQRHIPNTFSSKAGGHSYWTENKIMVIFYLNIYVNKYVLYKQSSRMFCAKNLPHTYIGHLVAGYGNWTDGKLVGTFLFALKNDHAAL